MGCLYWGTLTGKQNLISALTFISLAQSNPLVAAIGSSYRSSVRKVMSQQNTILVLSKLLIYHSSCSYRLEFLM